METINLDAIYVFFKEEISPKELAELLDKLLYHYVQLLIRAIKEDNFSCMRIQPSSFIL